MKALTLTEYNHFEYGDAPKPEAGEGEVLIRVKACGICGSDVHGMDGSSGRRIPPIIMGHEASGIIETVGEGVEGWNEGDAVTFDSMVYCGKCENCNAGKVNLCKYRQVMGVSCPEFKRHGAYAEYVTVPSHILYKIPEGMSFEEAAFAEPISVALHAVNRVPIKKGDTAVVIGAGLIGLLIVQALKRAGCTRVIAADLVQSRLDLAKELGATDTFLSSEVDVPAQVLKLTNGKGADVAMEVVGIGKTLGLAIDSVKMGGSVGCVGNIEPVSQFSLQKIVTREISLMGSCASAGEYDDALAGIADGSIKVKPLISKIANLKDGNDWFQKLHAGEDCFKVILTPDEVG
jgi:L-iditol 2-dehydrogenase